MLHHGLTPVWGRVAALCGLAASVALSACGDRQGPPAPVEPPPVPVVVGDVETRNVPVIAEFTGRLDAVATIDILARVEGTLEERLFEEGGRVEKDQVIFTIDDRVYAAKVAEDEAALAKAQADLRLAREQVQVKAAEAALAQSNARLKRAQTDEERLRPLAEIDAVPRQDLDNAVAAVEVAEAEVAAQEATLENTRLSTEIEIARGEAAVASAEARLETSRIDLGYCTVRAPVAGRIGKAEIDVGNVVGRANSSLLATLRVIDPIDVEFSLSETEYLKFAGRYEGEDRPSPPPLQLVLADDRAVDDEGAFLFAERTVDRQTGTISLRGRFPNPQEVLLPGMFGRVRANVDVLEDAVVVPRRAVIQQQTSRYVYLVDADDRVQQRPVVLGATADQLVVVESGLEPGDRIVVEGLQKVVPGVRVEPRTDAASAERAPASGDGS